MTLHREGYKYITLATVIMLITGIASYMYFPQSPILVGLIGLVNLVIFLLWLWIVSFFRMPSRVHTAGVDKIMCPADGKVVVIEETMENEYFKDKRLQVSVFMSPLNVHVNRNPISGIVKYMKYHPGKYLVAWHPKSSTENERTTIVIGNDKQEILMRQVAGALARRICYYVREGDKVEQNNEFGFIRFGSRVDLYLPLGTKLDVKIGDVVQSAVTVIGHH